MIILGVLCGHDVVLLLDAGSSLFRGETVRGYFSFCQPVLHVPDDLFIRVGLLIPFQGGGNVLEQFVMLSRFLLNEPTSEKSKKLARHSLFG